MSASHRQYVIPGLLLLLFFGLVAGGCKDPRKTTKKKEVNTVAVKDTTTPFAVTNPPTAAAATVDPDVLLAAKIIHHAECIGHASESVLRSRERYRAWIADPAVGPTGTEKTILGLYIVPPAYVESCKKDLKAAAAKKDVATAELDKLAATYETKLDAVAPLVTEAVRYYEQKDYQDDAFARGKKIHAALWKAFEDFAAADTAMRDELSKLRNGMAERELGRIEKDSGKTLLWHSRKMNIAANEIAQLVAVDADKLDLTKLEAALAVLDAELAETSKYAEDHKKEADKLMSFSQVMDAAKDFLKSAKSFMRQKRDKKAYAAADLASINAGNPELVDGHPAQVSDRYDKYVTRVNAVRW